MKKLIILLLISLSVNSQTLKDSLMVQEINNLRTNPKSYISLIQEYVKIRKSLFKNNPSLINEEEKAANEVIEILNKISPLPELVINKSMFKTTKTHTDYLLSINDIKHTDINNNGPFERFSCFKFTSVSENVGYINNQNYENNNFKTAIVELLIDTFTKNRGHRLNLLNPNSKYVSVHINKGIYVQNFAF